MFVRFWRKYVSFKVIVFKNEIKEQQLKVIILENGIIDTNREKKELELQVFELEKNIAGKAVLVVLVLGLCVLTFVKRNNILYYLMI